MVKRKLRFWWVAAALAGLLAGLSGAPRVVGAAQAGSAGVPQAAAAVPQAAQQSSSAAAPAAAQAELLPDLQNPASRVVGGEIKAIVGHQFTIAPTPGLSLTVLVPDDARMSRIEPGEDNLQNAATIKPGDLMVGDHIVVHGTLSDDNSGIVATSVILMKHAEPVPPAAAVAAAEAKSKSAQNDEVTKEDWAKRGVGGLVTAVDQTTGVVTIAASSPNGTRSVAIHQTSDTIINHYAADSVKLADAGQGSFSAIRRGDLLQARGAHSRDGRQLTADEIIFGPFRNIAGIVDSVDPATGRMTVTNRADNQVMAINITYKTQIRKFAAAAAEDIAARLRAAAEQSRANALKGASKVAAKAPARVAPDAEPWLGAAQADFEQAVTQMLPVPLDDLHAGDAVMIVGAPDNSAGGAGAVTAAIVVGGVESIVTTSLDGGVPVTIAPWDLGMATGNDAVVANP